MASGSKIKWKAIGRPFPMEQFPPRKSRKRYRRWMRRRLKRALARDERVR